ncbi:MAG TPA: phospholipid carrier-dependent glycosyltransferase [Chloroflexaceae bacterium]|nr:phospholipid carrier-dependent glycosyltransferase [Chloroflexaceae bacterium]
MAEPHSLPHRAALLAALVVFVVALLPRVAVLDWGLPYVEHADEPHYVEEVVDMVRDGDPNPNFFRHPTLVFYMLAVVTRAYGELKVRDGTYASVAELPNKTHGFTVDEGLYVWNRALIAVLGAATVALAFVLGLRMFGWPTALVAAALLAASKFHVEHSYYIATSGPTGLFATAILLAAWEVARTGRWRGYLAGGVATGLAAATKYNAGLIGLALGVGALIYLWDRRAAAPGQPLAPLAARQALRLGAAAALSLLVFFATNPFALLDWDHFYADVTGQSEIYGLGGGNFEGPWNVAGYAGFFWREGLRWSGSLLLLAGLPLLLRRAPRQTALLLATVAAELLLLLSYTTNFVRNLLIIYPAVALLAAAATVELAAWVGRLVGSRAGVEGPQTVDIRPGGPSTAEARRAAVGRRATGVALAILGALLIIPHALDTRWLLGYWGWPHTLVQAAEALRAQPRGMLAAVETRAVQWAGDPAVHPENFLGEHGPAWYSARGYRYLLLNDERYGPDDQGEYRRLLEGGEAILTMPPRRLGLQPGPGGAVVDLGERLELMPFTRREARFGEVAALLGYELGPGEPRSRITPLEGAAERELAPGQPVQINLYWRALGPTEVDYTLFVHVYDAAGARVAQRDLPLRYEDYPTSRWRPGELVIDRADMPLPALPPGEYSLQIGLYDAATGAPLPAEGGAPVVLTTISVQ